MLEELLEEVDGEVDEVAQALAAAREARKKKAKDDFFYFCKTYLPQAFPIDFAPYQKALIELVSQRALSAENEQLFRTLIDKGCHEHIRQPNEGEQVEGVLDIEPRDHGKTTRNTQALPLWLALNYPGCFPVICAASKDSAMDMVDAIKTALEENELIIEDYGLQKIKGKMWAKRKIQLANGSAIAAVGAGQPLRGIKDKFTRPTHIICDDLLKDDEVESATSRNKIYKWFKRVILNLGKGALTIVANTIMHPDDLPNRLLNEIAEGTLENWVGLRFAAILPGEDGKVPDIKDIMADSKPLWPERWPIKEILKKIRVLGTLNFTTEWLNQPMADEDRKFQEDWFEFYDAKDLTPQILRRLKIAMAIDPATGKKTGDYSAIVVVGKDPETGLIYVLYAWGEKVSDLKLAFEIIKVYLMYKPKYLVMEDIAFQEIYKRSVAREASRQNVRLPLKGFKGGNKDIRIQSLSAPIENGIILFKETQKLLKSQLLDYPKGNDDLPDALEMAISQLETGTFVGGTAFGQQYGKTAIQNLISFGQGVFR